MDIGIPRELKDNEYRIALVPGGTRDLVIAGHRGRVEAGAGVGSGFRDDDYVAAGAEIVDAATAWASDLVIKVKEPVPVEYTRLGEQMVFTYFHLAGADPALTTALLRSYTTAIAYETVATSDGKLPLLAPMSAVAGDMAVVVGNYHLARTHGGKGMMLARVLGRRFGKAVIIGDGVVGLHAAQVADAMGAEVTVFGLDSRRGQELQRLVSANLRYKISEPASITTELADADLVVGAVLRVGARTPARPTSSPRRWYAVCGPAR